MNEWLELPELTHLRLGAAVMFANDDFFAPKENLLLRSKPIFVADKYTERGKWMDGWESRRRREPGHDWCIVKLGVRGVVRGIDVDTSHFLGNAPASVIVEGVDFEGATLAEITSDQVKWRPLLSDSAVAPGSQNLFAVDASAPVTHVKLHILPDGGVARLRVYGDVVPDWDRTLRDHRLIDLACVTNGGIAVSASDQFFSDRRNLLMPDTSTHMGDGWETKRRRGPGHDWIVVRLGRSGTVERIVIETTHFRGNFPESCAIDAVKSASDPTGTDASWEPLVPRTKLEAHATRTFDVSPRELTHVRLSIYPDGGVARMRVLGAVR